MPNIKSSIKRVEVGRHKATVNKQRRSALRTNIKKTETAIAANDAKAAELLKDTQSKLDQAVAKGLMKKNAASRKKSRLSKRLAETANK